ncbi:MAG: CRISPR-associated protein Cas4 [Candidatus Helarchaeota archaeon]
MEDEQNVVKDFNDIELNKHELDFLRLSFPKIHLYESPMIGTEEIRQYIYCKRIIYFRHVIKAPMEQTVKMELGTKKHEILQALEGKDDESSISKYYNIYLTDPQINLVGVIDYFEFDGKEAYPVEIKTGKVPKNGVEKRFKYQIVAQAILIEKNFNFLVKKAKIAYTKEKKVIEIPITIDDKIKVMEIIREIQKIIKNEEIPPPTKDKAKCVDCECRKYC